jgi:hypothetical protein
MFQVGSLTRFGSFPWSRRTRLPHPAERTQWFISSHWSFDLRDSGLDPCPTTPPPPYAITGVSVLPMDRERVLEGYTVIVRNGAIETLGPADKVSVPGMRSELTGGEVSHPRSHRDAYPPQSGCGDPDGRSGSRLALANVTTLRGLVAPPGIIPIRDKVNSGAILGPTLYVAGPSSTGSQSPTLRPDGGWSKTPSARIRPAQDSRGTDGGKLRRNRRRGEGNGSSVGDT